MKNRTMDNNFYIKDALWIREIINVYDLNYTGCKSCFACKRLEGKSYGKCAVKDDIHEVLEKVSQADGLIFGSPVYFGTITGQLQSISSTEISALGLRLLELALELLSPDEESDEVLNILVATALTNFPST